MKTVTVCEYGVSAAFEVYTFGAGAPHVMFTAGVHGNEVSGIYTAQKLMEYLGKHPPLRGTVTVIPTVNATAFRAMQRRSPFDGEDLNRIFPGDREKSLSHRLAAALWEETAQADLLVDLHCCGQHGTPYLLSVYSESEPARALVSRIPMGVAIHSEGTPGQLFTEAGRRRGQAACIIELPSGVCAGAVNLDAAEQCFAALLDLLRTEGMVEGEACGASPVFCGPLQDAQAPCAGLWSPQIARGVRVAAGQIIGTVDGKEVCAPAGGQVMSVLPRAYLLPDDLWVMTYTVPRGE